MENQNIRVTTQWEHSLTNLLRHDPTSEPGIALRQWVHHQGVENHLDLLSWEEDEVKANPTQQVFSPDDHRQGSYLRTNQTKQICGLITYMKHVFRDYNSGIEVNVGRNTQVRRDYTTPHKTQMIDTTINLLVNWTECTNLPGTTLTLRLAVKSDNSSPAILFHD